MEAEFDALLKTVPAEFNQKRTRAFRAPRKSNITGTPMLLCKVLGLSISNMYSDRLFASCR